MTTEERYRQALEEISQRGMYLGGDACQQIADKALEPPGDVQTSAPKPNEWAGLGK